MSFENNNNLGREIRSSFWANLPGTALMYFALIVVIGLGSALSLVGQTKVENAVYQNSYQKKQGDATMLAVQEASLAEVNSMLAEPDLDPAVRINLKAQARAINIRINTIKGQQQ